MNRKQFLKLSSLGLSALSFKQVPTAAVNKPIVISTWDSGMAVNAAAWKILGTGGKSVDAVEAGAISIENEINCCVGLGGYPDRDGIVTLDACIMDEHANCGAVAGLEQIKHPISVARKVMELTPHVLLVGNGAQQFALENGFTKEPAVLSKEATDAYNNWLKEGKYKPVINIENQPKKTFGGPFAPTFFNDGTPNHDTMGLVAMDATGNLSGAVTTSGMAFKIHGRVGDSPVIGAGLFVDNEVGAATSSGTGEEVIRICGTHLVVEFMRQGYSPEMACKKAVERIVNRDKAKAKTLQVGFLAMNKKGEHGAYAIQKGFVYSIKTNTENRIIAAKHLI
ncbi:N(4)-(beta-N-acetylglucosaminyl)-L-asparaginase [Ferruginibacter yonginensis]|uniref:N(4)-(Beta-N-acetylglucosaminyl)-L-asparaginase n=1 Tax=Ferruginibacter yonginensis TaxID=1310416 RepID=A0ABV8QQS7_9BACT